jgi:NTP pyrophosphatase (non-canonical NTP hydrolase)
MRLYDFQRLAHTTAVYPEEYGPLYTLLGLIAEIGEVVGKVAKHVRRTGFGPLDPDTKEVIAAELGDCLWFVAEGATTLDIDLEYVALTLLDRLKSRKERGVIQGDGDNR